MPQASYTVTMQSAGGAIGRARTRTGDALLRYEINLPAGNGGELTTRTSDTVGTATMDEAAHTISTSDVVNVFWDGGVRYGVTVGTVSGASVPFSGGSGDNLPAATTGLTITEQVTAVASIDGDNVQLIGFEFQLDDDTDTSEGHVQLRDSGAAEIAELDLEPNTATVYDIAGGDTNPFTGNPITELKAANGSTSQSATLVILNLVDSTP